MQKAGNEQENACIERDIIYNRVISGGKNLERGKNKCRKEKPGCIEVLWGRAFFVNTF
jgi:hypothetical protein